MASAIETTKSAQATPTGATSQNPPAASNRNGRRGDRTNQQQTSQVDGPRGGRRGGRGVLRGNRAGGDAHNRRRISNATIEPSPPLPPPPGLGGGGSFGDRLTEDATNREGEGGTKGIEDEVEAEAEAKFVIFTDDPAKRYEDFTDADFEKQEDTLGIKYEKKDIYEDTVLLLRYNCPDRDCDIACLGWPDLHRHVKSVHHKVMCDLCSRNKKVFTHEHDLFTINELRKHEKFGDDNPGAVDQSGFKGHPECGFCRQRFYGDDELYTHCRDKHERCHICDRRNQARQQQYFVDYNALEVHFRTDHFLCLDQECLDKKFVVFESEMDLKAHQLEIHPNGLSKDARRDARRVDISAFDYRTPHQQDNRGRREGHGRGRGRDPNVEAIPHSTAQPMRRDELAYQRQMAIQSAQSVSTRTFGGQLTSNDTQATRGSGRSHEPATIIAPRQHTTTNGSFPPIDSLNLGTSSIEAIHPLASPVPTQALTPQEQARRFRHNAVVERASNMLRNDQLKISEFRDKVSSYRTSAVSASQLIDSFFSLFDVPAADLSKLIKELADIYESDAKRNDLLKAWNDWRAINEDYPTLPGPSGILPGSSAAALGSGGRRVLKLKSSTQQSSRSAVSRQGSWGNATNANPFPPMPAASANRVGAGRVGATPWVTSSASSRPSPASSRPSSKAPTSRAANTTSPDAFPALPAAAKPNTTMFGYTTGAVRWNQNRDAPPTNPWGNGTSSSASDPPAVSVEQEESDVVAGGKRKGNKNKKQTLYRFG
ncbi:MAG: hypothetical protein M1830_003739 [Pleopsidium flavum]|nr:MAG: hypothetical protein M1830_003739 [Pleopsidium flavum]